jgi:hypothetical protein
VEGFVKVKRRGRLRERAGQSGMKNEGGKVVGQ